MCVSVAMPPLPAAATAAGVAVPDLTAFYNSCYVSGTAFICISVQHCHLSQPEHSQRVLTGRYPDHHPLLITHVTAFDANGM